MNIQAITARVGGIIRTLREIKGLSQAQLAGRAKISTATLSSLETGAKPDMKLSTLGRLASVLGADPAELMLGATRGKNTKRKRC